MSAQPDGPYGPLIPMLERIVDAGAQDPADAITEIRRIREAAEAEAGL